MKLEDIKLFKRFRKENIVQIQKSARVKKFCKGEVILPNNTPIEHIYFVLTGRVVETAFTKNGKEVIFNSMYEGDCFGLLSLINNIQSKTEFIAKTECEICAIGTREFSLFMSSDEAISKAVLLEFSNSILKLFDRLYDIRALDVSQRTCVELLRYTVPLVKTGAPSDMGFIQSLPTHEEIANTIFSHREAVTKELGKLKKMGAIKDAGKCQYIVDVTKLNSVVDPVFT